MKYPVESVSRDIQNEIEKTLNQMGIMYRIFGRVKDTVSLKRKLDSDERYGKSKLLQDYIGIRIVLYFVDDVSLVHRAISNVFVEREKDQSIDDMNDRTFMPVRYNLVYDVLEKMGYEPPSEFEGRVDKTFELQIRTVLSEGWHEVEHDFRYKCKNDWVEFPTESRKLNGVYASLETNEWTMLKIFDEIAYGHYKRGDWVAMLRQKFRLRLSDSNLDEGLKLIFDGDKEVAKKFYRVDREELLRLINEKKFDYPISLTNLVYFANILFVRNQLINDVTPDVLKEDCLDSVN